MSNTGFAPLWCDRCRTYHDVGYHTIPEGENPEKWYVDAEKRERAAGIPADYAEACAQIARLRKAAELAREALDSLETLVFVHGWKYQGEKLQAALAALAEALDDPEDRE